MLQRLVRICASLVLLTLGSGAHAELQLLSEIGSERATTGPGNNIVTHAGKTHVVWQDCDEKGYANKIRTLDRENGKWSDVVTLGPGVDNHARPCIAIDEQGYLHVVLGGHNTMMYYLRSEQPNDSSTWTKRQSIDNGTYPMLVCGPEGTLVLAARPKTHSGVNLYVRTNQSAKWEPREQVLKRNAKYSGYAGYNVALAWGQKGELHFSADVYEGRGYTEHRGTHQAIVYMVSRDLGKTWQKADGTPLPKQVDPTEPDVLASLDVGVTGPAQTPKLRNGGVAIDSKGRAFVYFTEIKDGVARPNLATFTSGAWQSLPIADAFQSRWPSYETPGARGHLTIASGDVLHVLVELYEKLPPDAKPARFSRRIGVGLMTSRDGGQSFDTQELLPLDPAKRFSQASLERQTGFNDLSGRLPSMIITDGRQEYPAKGEIINNKILWLQP